MMTIVEKMARAICEASFQSWPDDSYNGRDQQRFYRNQALAALRALREPSEGMWEHALPYMDSWSSNGAWWRAMIDFAIHEAEEKG